MRRLLPAAFALGLLLAGCGGSGRHAKPPTSTVSTSNGSIAAAAQPATGFTDWPNYHRTPGKTGHGTGSVKTPLHRAWTAKLNGSVWEEPVPPTAYSLPAPSTTTSTA